jgi:hypothetical protein
VEDKIEDNLLIDHCRQSRMTLETSGWKDHQTSGDWVAILNSQDQLSLFNIESQKCVWSLPMTNAENHEYNKLIVFRDGTVIYVTNHITTYDLQIFQHGKKTGNIEIGPGLKLSSLRLVGDHIVGAYDFIFDEASLHLWDKSGSLLKRIRAAYPHCFHPVFNVTANDVFYIVADWRDSASLFFIYNSNDQNARSVRLSDDKLQVTSVQLVNDKIICAAYRYRWENDSAFSVGYRELTGNAVVMVLDANSGSIEKTFVNQKKSSRISHIVATEHYIVYRLTSEQLGPEFYCIDRQTAETYPLAALSERLRHGDNVIISLTLTQRALSVHFELRQYDAYPRPLLLSCDVSLQANVQKPQRWLTYLGGFFSRRADREEMETKLVIREYPEIRFDSHDPVNPIPLTKSVFSNNKMMLFYSRDHDREQLYIEDYLAEPEEKVDETCSARINRP